MNKYTVKITTTIALLSSLLTGFSFAGEKVNKSLTVAENSNITIENVRGEIKISGWRKNTIQVQGELDDEAEKFIFEKRDDGVLIKVVTPRNLGHGSFTNNDGSNLIINLPQNARVNFSGVSTDVTLKDIKHGTNVNSVSGNIEAKNLAEYVDISSVSGDINTTNLNGKISLNSVSGEITDKHSQGRLRIESVSGNIHSTSQASNVTSNNVSGEISLNLQKVDELELNTVSDDVTVTLSLNDHGVVKGASVSGDLALYFTNNVQASFRLNSNVNDDIINKLTDKKAKKAKYGPGAKLNFETGNGSASVRLTTVSGDIKVAKK